MPLLSIHPKSQQETEAMECAAELGGEKAFWKFTDRLYQITPGGNSLPAFKLPMIATYAKLNKKAFKDCLKSGRHAPRVQKDVDEAKKVGIGSTPTTVVIIPGNEKRYYFIGSQSEETLIEFIDGLLHGDDSIAMQTTL